VTRDRRSEREAKAAARQVFEAAGWKVRDEVGGKHKLVVATRPDGVEHRLPVCNSPSHGVTGAVNLAVWNARRLIRQFEGLPA
jgi:hypothetical protein